ncbi:hypothetical protein GCM10009765_68240 [Fodinicola feengrottensis]|uniref:OmpR/PhoB-type domain-containing protein n=1 Tax=Fodinicola feengrottensis TaxID=435914 RepID=A0ABP4UP33_9ACTN
MGKDVEIRVLGPLQVTVAGRCVQVPDGKPRTLLGALIARAGHLVSFDRLADLIWDQRPPERTAAALQTCAWRLRRSLGVDVISTHPHGYRLNDSETRVDLIRFHQLLTSAAAARSARSPAERDHLTEALALWRGPAFVDIPSSPLRDEIVPPLTEERLAAYERRIDLDLNRGLADRAIAELRTLIGEHPLRESLWSRLLKALALAGRPAEALAAYHDFRGKLVDQLGVEPGGQLSSAYLRLLTPLPRAAEPAITRPRRHNQRPYA